MDIQQVAFRVGAEQGSVLYGDGRYDLAKVGDAPTLKDAINKDLSTLGPADGQITMDDFFIAQSQFGQRCRGPLTFSLADISPSCDGNFREAGGVVQITVPEPGKILKDCLLVRNAVGNLVNVVYEETSAQKGATIASNCIGCVPGSDPATWYETSKSVKKEQKWPPDWLRCTPGFGFLPQVCSPQVVTAGLYLTCRGKYLVSSNIYNGVVVPGRCDNWPATNYPWRMSTLYDIQSGWNVVGFENDVSDRALFEYAPIGELGTLQQLMFEVEIVYGPGGWSSTSTR